MLLLHHINHGSSWKLRSCSPCISYTAKWEDLVLIIAAHNSYPLDLVPSLWSAAANFLQMRYASSDVDSTLEPHTLNVGGQWTWIIAWKHVGQYIPTKEFALLTLTPICQSKLNFESIRTPMSFPSFDIVKGTPPIIYVTGTSSEFPTRIATHFSWWKRKRESCVHVYKEFMSCCKDWLSPIVFISLNTFVSSAYR